MKDSALLVGNGPNNIAGDYTWSILITELISYIGASGQISVDDKPFPLLYEEIFIKSVREKRGSEEKLKGFIATKIEEFHPNSIHEAIINLGCQDIMTTNYDHALEKVVFDNPQNLANQGIVKESKYSLFRHNKIDDTRIWHIHGDANLSDTIVLGFEHYSGYLHHMKNYVDGKTGTSYKEFQPQNIFKNIKSNQLKYESWIDLFFTKNIYIIGFSFDFAEIDLWWLLTYRARCMYQSKSKIKNDIYYFYPESYGKSIKNKIELLSSHGVICYSIKYSKKNPKRYYERIIQRIKNGL